jgi:hypothetical protein
MIKSLYQKVDEIANNNNVHSLNKTLILFIQSNEMFHVSEYIPKRVKKSIN